MRIFLRILVIFLMLLSITALILGARLFAKRELLKGRTQKLETYLTKLCKFIETAPAAPENVKKEDDPERDISPIKDEILENTEKAKFWTAYKYELEVLDLPTVDLPQVQLKTYYQLHKTVDGMEELRDPQTGYRYTYGPGTMDELLTNVVAKAEDQLNRLNLTRQELKKLRIELGATIVDLNSQKKELRSALKTITDLKAEIVKLKADIEALKKTIEDKETKIKDLEDTIVEKNKKIDTLNEELTTAKAEIVVLKKENETYRRRLDDITKRGDAVIGLRLPPGEKGKASGVNLEHQFIVADVSDEFITDVLGPKLDRPLEHIEFSLIRRVEGKPEIFITKVRLTQIRPEKKTAIFDILPQWTQKLQPSAGDVIISY